MTIQSPQAQRLGVVLKALKIDITEQDRLVSMEKYGFRVTTLSNYLNGHGLNSDLTIKLIEFFRERIAERDRIAGVIPLEPDKQTA